MTSTALDYLTAALNLIYPLNCGGCDAPGSTICEDCLATFAPIDETKSCPLCGRSTGVPLECGSCMSQKRHFSAGHFGFFFSDRLRDALLAFKFRQRKDVGRFLMGLLQEKIGRISERFDLIVPLPVTEGRLRERGFNQTYILSEEIARMTHKPIGCRFLVKTRETKDQYTLGREARMKNLMGVFVVRNPEDIKGCRILLVDDLFTTGATASEAAKALLRAKAARVEVFALARTP